VGLKTKTAASAVSATGLGLAGIAAAKKSGWFRFRVALRRGSRKPSNYEAALANADAYATLWRAVRTDLRERGVERGRVIAELEKLLDATRASRREDQEDAVTGVLDSVEGFAPAHSRL
jgi:hypothetical protein